MYANKVDNLEEMDKFLRTYNLPRLNPEKIKNLNRPITSKEIGRFWLLIQSPEVDGLTVEFYQTFKEYILILLKLFKKKLKRERFQSHLRGQYYPDTKLDEDTRKENYRLISLMNIDTKILNKILSDCIQQHIRRSIHHN